MRKDILSLCVFRVFVKKKPNKQTKTKTKTKKTQSLISIIGKNSIV